MKESEAVVLATKIQAAWPGQGMSEASIGIYAQALLPLDTESVHEAIDVLIRRSAKLPSVADVLGTRREVRQVTNSPAMGEGTYGKMPALDEGHWAFKPAMRAAKALPEPECVPDVIEVDEGEVERRRQEAREAREREEGGS